VGVNVSIYDENNIGKEFVYYKKGRRQRWSEESTKIRDMAVVGTAKGIKRFGKKKKRSGLRVKLPRLRYW
jgi:hypothetical protein